MASKVLVLATVLVAGCGGVIQAVPAPQAVETTQATLPRPTRAEELAAADALAERVVPCIDPNVGPLDPETDRTCVEALDRAAAAYEHLGVAGKAIILRREVVLRFANDKPWAAQSLYQLGTDYQAMAEYDLAASSFERFATENPAAERAPDALGDALVLRVGLGQDASVASDVAQFMKMYATSRPELAARVAYANAAHTAETREDWAGGERVLASSMALIDRGGATHVRMMAHALMGKMLARRKNARAASEYALVRSLAPALPQAPPDASGGRNVALGLIALGAALVFEADGKRASTTWPRLAAYIGSASDKDVDQWIATKVAPWIEARKAAITPVEAEYRKVVEITPFPPPAATVDAAARVASMWGDAADEALASAPPKGWSAAAQKSFREKIAKAAAPLSLRAKAAATSCVALSTKLQWSDEAAAGCGAWLTKRYRAEWPPLDELLLPRVTMTGPPIERAAPLP